MYFLHRYSTVIVLFESAAIFAMTILGVCAPYIQVIMYGDDILNANWEGVDALIIARIVNLVLAGAIAACAFRGSLRTLGTSGDRQGSGPGQSPASDA